MNDGRVLAGVFQHHILHQEFYVTQTTLPLFEVEQSFTALVELFAHFVAH